MELPFAFLPQIIRVRVSCVRATGLWIKAVFIRHFHALRRKSAILYAICTKTLVYSSTRCANCNNIEKNEKNLKKSVDNLSGACYNNEAVAENGGEMVFEN